MRFSLPRKTLAMRYTVFYSQPVELSIGVTRLQIESEIAVQVVEQAIP